MKSEFGSWIGEPIMKLDGFTANKKYRIYETRKSKHDMRPVEVENDNGKVVLMFAARFAKVGE